MRNIFIVVANCLFLSACSSMYVAELEYLEKNQNFLSIENTFSKICSEIKKDGRLRVIERQEWNSSYEKTVSCDSTSLGYMQIFLVLGKPLKEPNIAKVLWGTPASHLGTRIGNTAFPKWYCDEYLKLHKKLNENNLVAHDLKLKEKCNNK